MRSCQRLDLEDPDSYLRPNLSVYLACSLTAREDRDFKDQILAASERTFTECGYRVCNPGRRTPPGSPHTASEVCLEDLAQVANADLVFFLRFGRSHGMGIEAQVAADLLVPWADALVSDDSHKLTPLLAGLANGPSVFRATLDRGQIGIFCSRLKDFLRDRDRRILEELIEECLTDEPTADDTDPAILAGPPVVRTGAFVRSEHVR